ncbi:MAG TPA: hypothetical protein VN256_11190 [Pyrinomonadaceae bacterium]|nr:hypothetical protein [Pyrinomonadaceae bacterium]
MKKSNSILTAAVLTLILTIGPASAMGAMTLSYQKTWGGFNVENAEGVAVAPDGSVYVVGGTNSFGTGTAEGDSDAFLLKYAPDGTLLWQRTYGVGRSEPFLAASEVATDVAVGEGGAAVYVSGFTAAGHAFLAKFDSFGNLVWQTGWGGSGFELPEAVAVAPDGSIYITGFTNSFGAGQQDAFLVKFTPAGTVIWDRTWGGAGLDAARDVAVAADGSVYVAGDTNSFFANDAFLLKYAPNGNIIWERDWREGTIEDISGALGVATGPDGSVYVTGLASINQVGQNIFLLKFTSAGGLVWEKTWGARLDAALGVAVGPDGNIYVTGNTGYGEGNGDAFVVKFLPNGKARHASTWGGAENESGQAIAVGADGAVYVAGVASAPPYVFDRAPTKTKTPDAFLGTPAGTVTAPAASQTGLAGIVLTPDGSQTFAGNTDAFLLKILP